MKHIEELKLLSVPAPTDPTPSLSQADKYIIPAILELADQCAAIRSEIEELKALVLVTQGDAEMTMSLQEAVKKFADSIDPNVKLLVIE